MTAAAARQQDMQALPDGGPRIKLGMEVPLWGVLVMVFSVVGTQVQTYYSSKAQGEQLTQVALDVRSIQADLNKSVVQNANVQFRLDDYLRRLQILEAAVAAQAAQAAQAARK